MEVCEIAAGTCGFPATLWSGEGFGISHITSSPCAGAGPETPSQGHQSSRQRQQPPGQQDGEGAGGTPAAAGELALAPLGLQLEAMQSAMTLAMKNAMAETVAEFRDMKEMMGACEHMPLQGVSGPTPRICMI